MSSRRNASSVAACFCRSMNRSAAMSAAKASRRRPAAASCLVVDAVVPKPDPGPFRKRRIDPRHVTPADLQDLLARHDPHDLGTAHAASPIAALTASRSRSRSSSGSWNQRWDDTRWITGIDRRRMAGRHISRARARLEQPVAGRVALDADAVEPGPWILDREVQAERAVVPHAGGLPAQRPQSRRRRRLQSVASVIARLHA